MGRRKKTVHRSPSTPAPVITAPKRRNWAAASVAFLAGSGILLAMLTVAYQYQSGDVSLEFVQASGRAYEFQLKNDTPLDRMVKTFRVKPPPAQKIVYRIIEDIYANIDDQGRVSLPGGNISHVPAAEFKELDGQRLTANSSLSFRIPPLSSRSWAQPEATIVDMSFEHEPANAILAWLESLFEATGIRSNTRTVRYLVIENYWTVSNSTSLSEAIRVFCRDNDSMAKASPCVNER